MIRNVSLHPRVTLREVWTSQFRKPIVTARLRERLPAADLAGIDVSPDMLRRAGAKSALAGDLRVGLVEGAYTAPMRTGRGFDAVVLSYCLSMINPGGEWVLDSVADDLCAYGRSAGPGPGGAFSTRSVRNARGLRRPVVLPELYRQSPLARVFHRMPEIGARSR